ncbi:MAG TPA: helix-turn-helix domain-containing protein [Sedimentisphaerales bacterium]|nr:helix-turn-helix domain-containing protein [Sedimentisphaerales bacterium]
MKEENPQLMTVEDVAEYLRIKSSTVYEWASNGKLPGVKIGRLWRFERSEIEKWVRENRQGNGGK